MKKTFLTFVIITLFNSVAFGQTRIKLGDNSGIINKDAALEVESTNKGILFPRMALTQISSPSPLSSFTQGMIVFNTATANDVVPGLYYSDGSKWIALAYSGNNTSNQVLFGTGSSVTSSPNLTYSDANGLTLSNNNFILNSTNGNAEARFQLTNYNGGNTFFSGYSARNVLNGSNSAFQLTSWTDPATQTPFLTANSANGIATSLQFNANTINIMGKSTFSNLYVGSAATLPTLLQPLHVDGRMQVANGVIQTGGSVGITNTSDLGLYSCTQGNWIRIGTNQAPIKFFSDMDTNGGIGTNYNMTIESNGNVGIGSNFTPSNKLDVNGNIRSVTGGLFSELDTASGPFMNLNNSLKTTAGVKQNWRLRNAYNSGGTSGNGLFFSSYDGSNQNAYDHMFLADNGNVGIGTNNPQQKLEVSGSVLATGGDIIAAENNATGGNISLINTTKTQGTAGYNWQLFNSSTNAGLCFQTAPSQPAVVIGDNGNVSIGTGSSTSKAKLEVKGYGNFQTPSNYGYLANNQSIPTGYVSGIQSNISYSIYADWRIAAGEFNAFSDARIKNIKGKSNRKKDLQILKQIEITDYTKKDSIADANAYKKVIAQQVEKVYPQAVHQTKGFIPNIYKSAQAVDGQIKLMTDFKQGDKIKLILASGELEAKVIQVENGSFKIDKTITEKVFVFGKEIDDFRNVDYEAIAMLNVSATQELINELEIAENKMKKLLKQNQQLENALIEIESKLKELQKK